MSTLVNTKEYLKAIFKSSVEVRLANGCLDIDIHDDSAPSLNGELIQAIVSITESKLGNIKIGGWQETSPGCDTCAHGRKGNQRIEIDTQIEFAKLEANSLAAHTEFEIKEEEEDKVYEAERDARETARIARGIEAERQNKLRQQANIQRRKEVEIALNTFNTCKPKILEMLGKITESFTLNSGARLIPKPSLRLFEITH